MWIALLFVRLFVLFILFSLDDTGFFGAAKWL
jgi:hypothetical protein